MLQAQIQAAMDARQAVVAQGEEIIQTAVRRANGGEVPIAERGSVAADLSAEEIGKLEESQAEVQRMTDQIHLLEVQDRQALAASERVASALDQQARVQAALALPAGGEDGNILPDGVAVSEFQAAAVARVLGDLPREDYSFRDALASLDITDHPAATDMHRTAFRRWCSQSGMNTEQQRALNAIDPWEARADIISDNDTQGGVAIIPLQLQRGIIENVADEVFILDWGRKIPLRFATTLGVVRLSGLPNTFAWGQEIAPAPVKDDSTAFDGRELRPHYLSGEIRISRDWLRRNTVDGERYLMSLLRRHAGEVIEDAGILGSGNQRPLGIMTPHVQGISTARDISTGSTTTALTFDGTINALGQMKYQYRPRLKFLTSRTGHTKLRLEKNAGGVDYVWQHSVQAGFPDTVNGVPAFFSERMPADFTADKYVAIMGDFDFLWWAIALDWTMQRLIETHAGANMDAFQVRMKLDAQVVLEEAFVRMKTAP